MNIALLGPSGSGKGTQAPPLCRRFGLEQVSTGHLLRQNITDRSPLGLRAAAYMERGELVPDELVDEMIEKWLRTLSNTAGILFDGFPRTPEQAAFLDELFKRTDRRLDAVIYLKVSEAEALSRLAARLFCGHCHAAYDPQAKPPLKSNLCDLCGHELQARPDDVSDFALKKLRVFQRNSGPVLDYYHSRGLLHLIEAGETPAVVQSSLVSLVEALSRRETHVTTGAQMNALRVSRQPATSKTVPERTASNLILLGGPGSGKGTQAEVLSREFALCHVASGDLFRENLKNATRLGQLAKSYMNRGELVPDDITEAMVEERLSRTDTNSGFLLDGFPRTLPQAEALTEMLARLGHSMAGVLYLKVSDASLVTRLSGRWICRNCQTPFHLTFKPPARDGICDKCGGELFQRDDDKPDTVRARLKTFHKQTEPLIDYYNRERLLIEIDGEGDVESVSRRTVAQVRDILQDRTLHSHQHEGGMEEVR